MTYSRIIFVATILMLGACASTPDYVAADNASDYGHYTRKISDDRYRVNYNGRRSTDLQDARDYAMLRAAELTLNKGYDWFQIVDRETSTIESREPEMQVGFGYEQARHVETYCGVLTCTRTERPTRYTSMHFDNRRPEVRHSHSIEIVMGKGKVPENGNYYDAKAVAESIGESA